LLGSLAIKKSGLQVKAFASIGISEPVSSELTSLVVCGRGESFLFLPRQPSVNGSVGLLVVVPSLYEAENISEFYNGFVKTLNQLVFI
jgi:hypothetical protein